MKPNFNEKRCCWQPGWCFPSLSKKKGLGIFSVKSTWQSGDDITTLKFWLSTCSIWMGRWVIVIPGINFAICLIVVALDERGREVIPLSWRWPYKLDDLIWWDQQLSLTSSPRNIPAPAVPSCFLLIHLQFSLIAIISVSFNCCANLIVIYSAHFNDFCWLVVTRITLEQLH